MKKLTTKEGRLLKNVAPALIKEWHPTKNSGLDLNEITYGVNLKVWWICEHGHEWEAYVNQRVRGTGCPYCMGRKVWVGFNDLATTHPHVANEWHTTKNGDLTPQQVTRGCNKKVFWKCSHGHEWKAAIKHRAGKEMTQCPTCQGRGNLKKLIPGFNDLATTHPQLVKEWHPTKNTDITPQQVSYGMGRKVWWHCSCGCEWEARILSRHQGRGCPECGARARRKPRTYQYFKN